MMMSLVHGLAAKSRIRSLLPQTPSGSMLSSVRWLQMQSASDTDIFSQLRNLSGNQGISLFKKRRKTKDNLSGKALKRLTVSMGKTAGRNNHGHITAFHRGGGAKRLFRKIDVKRNTAAAGVVERIEYDPNRSARIALVRWVEGVQPQIQTTRKAVKEVSFSNKDLESVTANISSRFLFTAMIGKVEQKSVACTLPESSRASFVTVGDAPSRCSWPNYQASEVSKPESSPSGSSLSLPRFAIAGANPAFYTAQVRDSREGKEVASLAEIRKWNAGSVLWQHRIKRNAAISWHSLKEQKTRGLAGVVEDSELKPTAKQGRLILSQVVSNALCSQSHASKSFYKDLLPVIGGHFVSLPPKPVGKILNDGDNNTEFVPVSYIPACHQLEVGTVVVNSNSNKNSHPSARQGLIPAESKGHEDGSSQVTPSQPAPLASSYDIIDLNSNVGNCLPLADIRMGTWIHNIEEHPGQGAKLVRSAGTQAKIIKDKGSHCVVRLPSGAEKLIDSRCRATIGTVSNPSHGARKLRKAGQSRWLGRRPIVRGVAMNPVDHPHGGGEGKTSGGRPSVSPWGKPTKAGYRGAAAFKKRKD